MASRPQASTSRRRREASAAAASTVCNPSTAAKSRTRRSSRPATRGVPRDRRAISTAPSAARARPRRSRAPIDDSHQVLDLVEIYPHGDAEPLPQRRGDQAGAGGGPDQGKRRQVDADGPRRRAFADDQVELEVLHGGIEDLFHRRGQAMDFVDEQHVPGLQVGKDCRQIAGLGDHRTGRGAKAHPQLAGDDLGQGGLAQPGRPVEDRVIQGLAPGTGRRR